MENKNKNIFVVIWILLTAFLATLPMFIRPVFCILDCPLFYSLAGKMDLFKPETYLKIPYFANRASYVTFLYVFPAYFSNEAFYRVLLHCGFLLSVSLFCIYFILYKITNNRLIAAIGASITIFNVAFAENFYTIFKGEPFTLTATLTVLLLTWYKINHIRWSAVWKFILFYFIALLSCIFIYGGKENNGAFFVVYVFAIFILNWGYKLSIKKSFFKTLDLTIISLGFWAFQLYRLLSLKSHYSATGGSEFLFTPKGILNGFIIISKYIYLTSPYVYLSAFLLILCFITLIKNKKLNMLKGKISWTLILFVYFGCMIFNFAPLQSIKPRYYLASSFIGIAFTIAVIYISFFIGKQYNRFKKYLFFSLSCFTSLLLIINIIYVVFTGFYSEAIVRNNFDLAYNDSFEFVAENTKSNGTAYFIYETRGRQSEARRNAKLWLDCFCDRPDIKCVYPSRLNDLNEPGYIIVSDYKRPPLLNYRRLPSHEWNRSMFNNKIAPKIKLEYVTNIFYKTDIFFATNHWSAIQYKSFLGIPEFWNLKKGSYGFGWGIYKFNGKTKKTSNSKMIKVVDPKLQPTIIFQPDKTKQFNKKDFFKPCLTNDQSKIISLKNVFDKNKITILAFGDSIVRAARNRKISWYSLLKKKLEQKYPGKKINFIMKAVGGSSTLHQTPKLLSDVIVYNPNLIFLHTAKNEKWDYYGYHQRLNWMIKIIEEFTNAKVVLWITSPYLHSQVDDRPYYYSCLKIADKEKCGLVDIRYALMNNKQPLSKLLWTDEKHPNRYGQEVMADKIFSYLCKAVKLNSNKKIIKKSFPFPHFATSPKEIPENKKNGLHPWNNKIELCTPLRVFIGTNAISEDWIIKFISPDSFSVSGSVTGFDGIIKRSNQKLLFSNSKRIAFQPNDIWWAWNTQLYFSNDIFKFSVAYATNNSFKSFEYNKKKIIPNSNKNKNLLKNSNFTDGLKNWNFWQSAKTFSNTVKIINVSGKKFKNAVRIENPMKKLVGIQQRVRVVSNTIYRLSGTARSVATNNPKILFGGRLGFFIPGQKEKQMVWMSEYNHWWKKDLIFTNQVTGIATVYVHMGYGGVASTGEFTNIRLEKLSE